ncbi:MAG TPA: protein kinase, partial [Kofleriaceae bacterium]
MGAEADAEEAFGPYLVYERLGVGGMATVHRALERGIEGFERIVALKRLLPHLAEDATFIKAFVREAKLASALNHVNIVQIYELGRVNTEYFISMEHIDGRDIRRVLRHARKVTGAPPPNVTVGLLLQLCDALDYAHTKIDENGVPMGLVHRDVSPSNVLVTKSGSVKVIDFGIAKAQSSQHRTQTGRVKGKLAYMAPEAISGSKDLDARSDLFAVGVIAHELLTARPLFASKNEYQTLLKVQRGDIMPPSTFNQSVPAELDAIVLRALARDPDDRFSSAAELRDELLALRHKYRMQTGVRDVSMWLDWAFTMDVPNDASAPVGDAPIADLAWGANDGSGSPIVLDEVPDVSQRIAMPVSQPIRETQPRLFDEDPSIDVRDDDDVDDIPTPAPQPPRRPSPAPARTTTSSRAASPAPARKTTSSRAASPVPARTTSSSRIVTPSSPPERRSSELLDALHAANDAAATLENMPAASAFGVDTQPTGRGLDIERSSTGGIERSSSSNIDRNSGQIERGSTGQIERSSTNELERHSRSDLERPSLSELDHPSFGDIDRPSLSELDHPSFGDIERPSLSELDDQTSVVTPRAPEAPTFDPALSGDDHITGENQADIDPTTGKSRRRAPTSGATEDERDAVIEPPRPGTKLGVGRDALIEPPQPGTKLGVGRDAVIEPPRPNTKLGIGRDAVIEPPHPNTKLGIGRDAVSERSPQGSKPGVGRDAVSERSPQGSKPGATRETVIERPQPGSKLGAGRDAAPSRDTPVPSRATPVPSRATPVPSRDTSIPLRDTPVPSRDTPVPSRDTPAPSRTAIGVARNTPNPSVKTAPMIPVTPPQRPTPDLSRATPDPSVSTNERSRATPDPSVSTNERSRATPDTSVSTNERSRATPDPSVSLHERSRATPDPSVSTNDLSLSTYDHELPTPDPSLSARDRSGSTRDPSLSARDRSGSTRDPSRSTRERAILTPGPSPSTPDPSLSTPDPSLSTPDPSLSTPDPSFSALDSLDSIPTHDPAVSAELASRRTGDIPRGSRTTGPEQPLDDDSRMVR